MNNSSENSVPTDNKRAKNGNRNRNNWRRRGKKPTTEDSRAKNNNSKKHVTDNPRPTNNKRPKRRGNNPHKNVPTVRSGNTERDTLANGTAPTTENDLSNGVVPNNSDSNPKKSAHITSHKFADLRISAASRRALAEVFRYEFMTAVQHETLPLILKDEKDCLAKAKTGTGKTLAFMIPTIEKITASNKSNIASDIYCLVISPTRELAQQIGTETKKLLSFHSNYLKKVVVCVGGTNKNKDIQSLSGRTPIVVATPGRLLDHLQNSGIAERMTRLSTLIFDEADQLLDMGFRPDIERILRLLQPSQQTRQTLYVDS